MHQDEVDFLIQTERWIPGAVEELALERGFNVDEVDDEFGTITVVDCEPEVLEELIKSNFITDKQKVEIIENRYDNVGFYWEY